MSQQGEFKSSNIKCGYRNAFFDTRCKICELLTLNLPSPQHEFLSTSVQMCISITNGVFCIIENTEERLFILKNGKLM